MLILFLHIRQVKSVESRWQLHYSRFSFEAVLMFLCFESLLKKWITRTKYCNSDKLIAFAFFLQMRLVIGMI